MSVASVVAGYSELVHGRVIHQAMAVPLLLGRRGGDGCSSSKGLERAPGTGGGADRGTAGGGGGGGGICDDRQHKAKGLPIYELWYRSTWDMILISGY